MKLLKFIYNNALTSTSAHALLDVLAPESSLLYIDLPSSVLMAEVVQPLTYVAKDVLIVRYKEVNVSHLFIIGIIICI